MADVTMLEAAKLSEDVLEKAVVQTIVEESPILEYLPMRTINGPAYRYSVERSLGSISFRGVNGTYTQDAGVINPSFEPLVILGGEVKVDNFEVNMMSNLVDLKAEKFRMKSRQVGITFSQNFFSGDTQVTPYGFDGMKKRLTGNQKILMGANTGATLTLAGLDQLLDSVIGDNSDKVFFCSPSMRRKITALVRAQTGSSLISFTQDEFGKQQMAYAGCPIRVVRRGDDGSTYLDYTEDAGGGNAVTASIYCVRFGSDFVMGIQGMAVPSVKDFGEVQAGPYHLGRIEWYCGLVVKHPRAASRLYGISNT